MQPAGTTRLLAAGGWPTGITNLIQTVWTRQKRWVCWESQTGAQPLPAGCCIPQGCPFGPLALATWMAAGHHAMTLDPHVMFSRIYMDDRTFISRSPSTLVQNVTGWQNWSQSVGLVENLAKTQFTAGGQTHCSRLSNELQDPSQVQTSFEVLGCSARVGPRQNSKTEKQRLEAARQTLLLLGNLRWSFERFWRACRSHALSKGLYGWIGRLPVLKDSWRIWAVVRRTQRVHQHANKFLRAIIFGGNSHLDCLSGTNLIRIVMQLKRLRLVQWSDRKVPGNPLWTLRAWCERRDYSADHRPFQWSADHPSFTINLCQQPVKAAQHAARQGWRWKMWKDFLLSGCHECPEVESFTVADFASLDFDRTRKLASSRPAYRAVIAGSLLSPACMQASSELPTMCPWCNVHLGHWWRVMWECSHRPVHVSPPRSVVAARFGWGATDAEVEWLHFAAGAIWRHRHGVADPLI